MKIIELSQTEYQNYELDCKYQTKAFYDISIKKKKDIKITIKKKKLRKKLEKNFGQAEMSGFFISIVYPVWLVASRL